jgi:hypothetical protein
MWGLASFQSVSGDVGPSHTTVKRMLLFAEDTGVDTLKIWGHCAEAVTSLYVADYENSLSHYRYILQNFETARDAVLVQRFNDDPRTFSGIHAMHSTWIRGYPDQARSIGDEILSIARQVGHPLVLANVLTWGPYIHHYCHEPDRLLELVEEGSRIARDAGLIFFEVSAMFSSGWSLVQLDDVADGIQRMAQGIAGLQALGCGFVVPFWRPMLVQALCEGGGVDPLDGCNQLAEVIETIYRSGELAWLPEANRIRGTLHAMACNETNAEADHRKSIEVARAQNAKSWELRAATSLAKLWQTQGKTEEAHGLLFPVYDWFTEGFGTADLKDAKVLLDELS